MKPIASEMIRLGGAMLPKTEAVDCGVVAPLHQVS